MRINYLDYLRILAIFFVIVIHVAAQNWHTTDVNGLAWQVFNFYDSIVRCGVPLFVMISGCLFLNKELAIATIYKKYILRLVVAYLAWNIFYCGSLHDNVLSNIKNIIIGKYHMWFIPMIIGLYIMLPVLKEIVKKKKMTEYFLLVSCVFGFLIPWLYRLIHDFAGRDAIVLADVLVDVTNKIDIKMVLGYAVYFVLGYYLNAANLSRKQRILIYSAGIIGFVSTVFLQAVLAIKIQSRHQNYYNNFSVNVLLTAIAVFTWFKYANFAQRMNSVIVKISKYSFGIYLVHVFILEKLLQYGINTLSFNPIASVIVISCGVYILSLAVSALLNNIPILKKYIV